MRALDAIKRRVEGIVERSSDVISSWAKKFASSPSYALEWGQDAFTAAAEFEAGNAVLGWLVGIEQSNGSPTEKQQALIDLLTDRVVQRAERPHRSTSAPANIIYEEVTAAFARILDYARGGL